MTAIRRPLAALVGLALCGLAAPPAWASSDYDACAAALRIDLVTGGLCDNVAALVPANDTRANLLLLLYDRHGLPQKPFQPVSVPLLGWRDFRWHFAGLPQPKDGEWELAEANRKTAEYASGEGARCRSAEAGAADFDAAVMAAPLAPAERAALVAARGGLMPNCAAAADTASTAPISTAAAPSVDAPVGVRSDLGHAFAQYVEGVASFYAARFYDAERAFAPLRASPDPWLADTAGYMVARTRVNALQADAFSAYGTLKEGFAVDPAAADRAQASLDGYLRDHPDGRYAASARGLLRRVDWLAGRTEALAARYAALMAEPPARRGIDDIALAEEIDAKLLPKLTPAMTHDPLLLAVLDLKAMRLPAEPRAPKPARPDLDAQSGAFAGARDLHAYLRAMAAFALDGASAPVIAGLPDDTRRRGGDDLWFSRQLLRGEALEAAGDRNAAGFWRELRPGADRPLDGALVELALALHDERHGRLDDVFAPDSIVVDPGMREALLHHDAGPALLRARARDAAAPAAERGAALATLLHKELTRGLPADFLADLAAAPAGAVSNAYAEGPSAGDIGCPALRNTAAQLAADAASTRGRLCLAEFIRLNGWDGTPLDDKPGRNILGGGPPAFPGQPYARSAVYAAIIADRAAPAENRAYALYRAVRCYEPSSDNRCGGRDVPPATRRGWFAALHRDYPGSRWAKRLTVWW